MDVLSTFGNLGFSAISFLLILALVLALSCYVKIVTVLSIVRLGLGANSVPSTFVTGSLALALSFFVMYPTLLKSTKAMDRVASGRAVVSDQVRAEALNAGLESWKGFLIKHVPSVELERFSSIARKIDGQSGPEVIADQRSLRILAPAFLVSELKSAFGTGLSLFLPFLVIELLVASILSALGMERLSPSLVSFPFKLLLFVMLDGWAVITANLALTYT